MNTIYVRIFYFQQLNRTVEWNLLKEDGSCSDSALDLLCTKIKLVHEAASGLILLKAKPDECAWLREALKQELDVPQDVKDSLYQILIC